MILFGSDVKVAPLVAAFFGAMAYAVILRVRNPFQLVGVVFVGLVVSYYMGPLIVQWLGEAGFSGVDVEGLQNAAGFVAGLSGMAICNGILAVAQRLGMKKKEE